MPKLNDRALAQKHICFHLGQCSDGCQCEDDGNCYPGFSDKVLYFLDRQITIFLDILDTLQLQTSNGHFIREPHVIAHWSEISQKYFSHFKSFAPNHHFCNIGPT